jgi:hypothetical protein
MSQDRLWPLVVVVALLTLIASYFMFFVEAPEFGSRNREAKSANETVDSVKSPETSQRDAELDQTIHRFADPIGTYVLGGDLVCLIVLGLWFWKRGRRSSRRKRMWQAF